MFRSIWKMAVFSILSSTKGKKASGDWAVAMVTKQKIFINFKCFETLWDIPNTFQGFRSATFVVLEIPGGSISTPLVHGVSTPGCLVWVHFDPHPLVHGVVPTPLLPEGLT